MVRLLKRAALIILMLILVAVIYYLWIALPIFTSYASKCTCSSVFMSGRSVDNVKKQELSFLPVSLLTIDISNKDSSATVSMFGLAKTKAIYRSGLGCTAIKGLSEKQVRSQNFVAAQEPAINTDTIPWPMGDLVVDSIPPKINPEQLQRALSFAFNEPDPDKPVRSRAVVVLYDGQIVAERYGVGFDRHSKLMGWSMTKSVTSALIGILVRKQKLATSDLAPVVEWRKADDKRNAITIEHLLQQTSGIKFDEVYDRPSAVTNMIFKKADMAAYVSSLPLEHTPGTVFSYSSGNTNVLSGIIRQTLGDKDYHSFPAKELFYKIGMYSAIMEPDASGTFVGSSFMYATARDWARFGLLYLQDGIWNKERILPEGWVKRSSMPVMTTQYEPYGYQFWLNCGEGEDSSTRFYPSAPSDMYFADGYEGQNVFIIPSRKLVIVRLGLTQGNYFDANRFLEEVLKAVTEIN